jgi:hypothetical protein
MDCGICMGAGADTPAPCGFAAVCFHKECLRDWWRTQQPPRCPHCNAREWPLRPVLDGLLKPSGVGCWVRGPVRAGLCSGPLHGDREERAVCDAVSDVIAAMRPAAVRVDSVDPSLLRFVCADAGGCELEVGLQRTAWSGEGGSVLADGFELTAVRRRVSARAPIYSCAHAS